MGAVRAANAEGKSERKVWCFCPKATAAAFAAGLAIVGLLLEFPVGRLRLPNGLKLLQSEPPVLRIAFLGNSLTYYNDLPHLVARLLEQRVTPHGAVEVGACLHGGASLNGLWEHGCSHNDEKYIGGHGMRLTAQKMLQEQAGWDIVVVQDRTQGPAQEETKDQSIAALTRHYLPLLRKAGRRSGHRLKVPVVVLYETWAYGEPVRNMDAIGNFQTMTDMLDNGYREYSDLLETAGLPTARAKVGMAFSRVHNHSKAYWQRLYQSDHFHPTALGTALAASHLVATMQRHSALSGYFAPGTQSTVSARLLNPSNNQSAPSDHDINFLMAMAGPPNGGAEAMLERFSQAPRATVGGALGKQVRRVKNRLTADMF